MTHVKAVLNQQNFRARNDDGSETAATWIATAGSNWTQQVDSTFRLRFLVDESAGADNTVGGSLEFNINGGGFAAVGSTTAVQFAASGTVTDGTATTQQIGTGTFVAGEFDSNGTASSVTLNNSESEFEYCLLIDSAQVADADSIQIREVGLDNYNATPTITVDVPVPDALLANNIESASNVSNPTLVEVDTNDELLANNIESASNVSNPAVGQEHVLLADDVESASNTQAAPLGQEHAIGAATAIESATEVSNPSLSEVDTTDDLLANNVKSASNVSNPAIGQEHGLLADDLESASNTSTAAVGQKHVLLSVSVESASNVSNPTLAEVDTVDDLLANDVESASEAAESTLGQTHVLLGDSIKSASEAATVSLGLVQDLLADDVQSASNVSNPAVADVPVGTDPLLAENIEAASNVTLAALAKSKNIEYMGSLNVLAGGSATLYCKPEQYYVLEAC